MKNRLITCSIQCKKIKVEKQKTTVCKGQIADWHIRVDRYSAQKGQELDWTRSITIFCFWGAQLIFHKHHTYIKDEEGSLTLQETDDFLWPPEQQQRVIPSVVLNGKAAVLSCCPVPVFASQSTEVKLPRSSTQYYPQMTKRFGKKTLRQVWRQLKHNPLCPFRRFSASSQLIASAATNSAHPLWSGRKFPASLVPFRASTQPLSSLPSLSWPGASGTILCLCFVNNKTYTAHKAPSPQLWGNFTYCINPIPSHQKNPSSLPLGNKSRCYWFIYILKWNTHRLSACAQKHARTTFRPANLAYRTEMDREVYRLIATSFSLKLKHYICITYASRVHK